MHASAIAAQADLLERAWTPPDAPSSGRLTAAIFAALRKDPELLELAAEIPEERLPPLLFLSSAVYLVGRLEPDPLQRSFPRPGMPQPPLRPEFAAEFRAFCLDHRDELRGLFATRRYQMSEVARCAHLLPALALAAAGGEVALLDLGTGAGFALHLDRYRYVYTDDNGAERAVGDPEAMVRLETAVRGKWWPPVPFAAPTIVARLGVDTEPVALDDPDVRAWLAACVPPEAGAVTRFEHAAALALAEPAEIVCSDAIDALPDLVDRLPRDVPVCLLDAYVHVFFTPAQRTRFQRLVAQLGRTRDLDWISLDPLVPLGPGARRTVIGIDVPPAIAERSRRGGVFGALARLSVRGGRARRSLLALGHPGGAWLEWLQAARSRAVRPLSGVRA
jgi:hypothetical protein